MSYDLVEWAQITPDTVVVGDSRHAWLHRLALPADEDPFATPMQHAGSPDSTRHLLEGALAAGQRLASRTAPAMPLTPLGWAWRLAGYYHTTHSTPTLMAEAAERFAAAGRQALAEYAQLKVQDEAGHDALALRDLAALGYDGPALVEAVRPATAAALVAYFTETVRAADPVGCVGYAYGLERMAISISRRYIDQVDAAMPPGVFATRCLRVHSSIGADVSHVQDALDVTARLPAADRTRIAQACYQTVVIRYSTPADDTLAEDVLERRFAPFRIFRN